MVLYSFQDRFLPAIRIKEKQQTIRLPRKRHARVGEGLQLYTGQRMRPVHVGDAQCGLSSEIRIDFAQQLVEIDSLATIAGDADLNFFAIRDGFRPPPSHSDWAPWEYMSRWWRLTHPDKPVFGGQLVGWGESFEAAA